MSEKFEVYWSDPRDEHLDPWECYSGGTRTFSSLDKTKEFVRIKLEEGMRIPIVFHTTVRNIAEELVDDAK